MSNAPTPAAGWYPDPDDASKQRYWDGSAWTDQRRHIETRKRNVFEAALRGIRTWLVSLPTRSRLTLAGLTLLVLISFASTGFGGGLIMVGLIALVTGIFSVATGRASWARVAGRKIGAAVLAGGLVATFIGSAAHVAAHPEDPAPVVAAAPTPTETLEPSPVPKKTEKPEESEASDTVVATTDDPTVSVPDSSATQTTALALLDTLPIKGRAPKTGYDREAGFGTAWLDVDHNGCDTRNDILARDLEPEQKSGPCKVLSGTLNDPYTGKVIDFVRGNATSMAVQIDHVVALMNAWETGAQQLTVQQRVSLANDPMNLFAVDGPTNSKKGAGDAATWLPPKTDFRCTYVARQVSVKATYGLWVTQAEHDAIARILANCPNEPAVTSSFTPVAQPAPAPAPVAEPAPVVEPAPVAEPEPVPAPALVYYENFTAARAAGAAPILRGEPGYAPKLDRDGDGVACDQ